MRCALLCIGEKYETKCKRNFAVLISFMDDRKTRLTVADEFYVRRDAGYDFPRIVEHL